MRHRIQFRNQSALKTGLRRFRLFALVLLLLLSTTTVRDAESALVEKLKQHQTTLRCENLKVALLLQAIGRQTGVNIFVADNIDDTITLDMEKLSLYDIFNIVMEAKQLTYAERNSVVFIERQADFQSGQKDVFTTRFRTQYGNVANHLAQLKTLSSNIGSMMVTNRDNCLIVKDRQPNLQLIEEMLKELDRPIPQVYIEAKIVSTSKEAIRRLGIKWGYANYRDAAELATTKHPITAVADLSIQDPVLTSTFGFIRDNLNLSVDLLAMEEDDMLRILTSPRILVLDGNEAEIKQGQEVPFVTQSGDLINTSFREANLSLKVTPKILKDQYLVLDVLVTNDSVDQSTLAGGEPLINKQEISTNLFLENGVTVVIGGILQESSENQKDRVPFLSRIPLLGALFRSSDKRKDRDELLVFLTPTIVNLPAELQPVADDAKLTAPLPPDSDSLPAATLSAPEKNSAEGIRSLPESLSNDQNPPQKPIPAAGTTL